jgi:hypothetical protein
MASSSFTRCPNDATPSSFQVLVRQAREYCLVYVILAEDPSYFPRPRLRSQTTTSMMMAPTLRLAGTFSPDDGDSGSGLSRVTLPANPYRHSILPGNS